MLQNIQNNITELGNPIFQTNLICWIRFVRISIILFIENQFYILLSCWSYSELVL